MSACGVMTFSPFAAALCVSSLLRGNRGIACLKQKACSKVWVKESLVPACPCG